MKQKSSPFDTFGQIHNFLAGIVRAHSIRNDIESGMFLVVITESSGDGVGQMARDEG